MRRLNVDAAIVAKKLHVIQIRCTDLPLRHEPKTPAMFTSIATCRGEFHLVFPPMLAQIVAVFYLAEHRRVNGYRCLVDMVVDQHVRRVRMASTIVVMIDDLDRLLFETLDLRIKIQKKKEITFQGGLERGHGRGAGVVDQPGKIAIVLWDD